MYEILKIVVLFNMKHLLPYTKNRFFRNGYKFLAYFLIRILSFSSISANLFLLLAMIKPHLNRETVVMAAGTFQKLRFWHGGAEPTYD